MKANRWIPLLVFCRGIVTTLSGIVHGFGGLVAVRFIPGMCEGGFLPGIVSAPSEGYCNVVLTRNFAGFVSEYHLQASRTAIAVSKPKLISHMMQHRGILCVLLVSILLVYASDLSPLPASLSSAFRGLFKAPHKSFSSFIIRFLGLLATAIIKMHGIGGLAGWCWIFILEGIATVLSSTTAAFTSPADITSARFLTEEERTFACMCILLKLGHTSTH